MRGTEKYAHETQLSKRVGAWQEKLEPLMLRSVDQPSTFLSIMDLPRLIVRAASWLTR